MATLTKPKLFQRLHKERDLDLLVRTNRIQGVEFVELRDHIPSTKTDSRGIVFDKEMLPDVIAALTDLNRQINGGSRSPGKNQGKLAGV